MKIAIGISGRIGHGKDTVAELMQKMNPDLKILRFADTLKDNVCNILNCTREQLEDRDFKEKELPEQWWVVKKWYPANKNHDKVYTLYPYVGLDSRIFDGDDASMRKVIKTTPRLMLQLLGTEGGRDLIHPNIWVNSLLTKFENSDSSVLIPDTRFVNEAEAIKSIYGILIKVIRPYPNGTEVLVGDEFGGSYVGEILHYHKEDNTYIIENLGVQEIVDRNKVTLPNEHASETGLDDFDDWDYIIDNNGTMEELEETVKQILEHIYETV